MSYNPFVDPEWRATQTQLTIGIQGAIYEVAAMAFMTVAAAYFVAYFALPNGIYLPGLCAALAVVECWRHTNRLKRLSANMQRQLDRLDAEVSNPL